MSANAITRACRYGTLSFLDTDVMIGRSLQTYGEWAQAEVEFLAAWIPVGGVAFDVGANVGTHTLAFARHVGPGGRVWAFEPQTRIFELLRANVERNGLAERCRLFNLGLAEAPGILAVAQVEYSRQSSFGSIGLHAGAPGQPAVTVPIETLDRCQVDACDFIKVDVEGMELQVLAGAQGTISRFRPVVSIECWNAEAGWPSLCHMQALQYRAFVCRHRAYNPVNFYGNPQNWLGAAYEPALLFVPSERVAAMADRIHPQAMIAADSFDDLVGGIATPPA